MNRLITALLLAGAAQGTPAGVIDFDDLVLGNFDPIAVNYADHGLNGNGDPRVGVRYSGSNGADNHLLFWNDLYGNLLKVGLTPTDGTHAEITLTADPGWLIRSIDFDLAAWPMVDLQFWPAVDLSADLFYALGAVSVDAPDTPVLGKTSPHVSHFALSNDAGASVATIRWGTDWDIGIDNIRFTVVRDASVPLPGTLALALLALPVAWAAGWRRRGGATNPDGALALAVAGSGRSWFT